MNTPSSYARFAALLAASALCLSAAEKSTILTLGYATSPLLQALRAKHTNVDSRDLMRGAKRAPQGAAAAAGWKAALKATVSQATALVADLGEVELTDDDVLMVAAANEAGVPIVLDNTDADKMSRLLGVGVDQRLVVALYDAENRAGELHFATPNQPDLYGNPVPQEVDLNNFGERLAFVERLLAKKPAADSRASVTPRAVSNFDTNGATPAICSLTPAGFPGSACKFWKTYGLIRMDFCPSSVLWVRIGFPNRTDQTYGAYNGTCKTGMVTVRPELNIALYQVGPDKYIQVQTAGGIGVQYPYGPMLDTVNERFPFFSEMDVYFKNVTLTPYNGAAPLVRSSFTPWASNTETSITTSSGFQISGGNGGFGVTYDSSKQSTITSSDFAVEYVPVGLGTTWKWYLRTLEKAQGGTETREIYQDMSAFVHGYYNWLAIGNESKLDKIPQMAKVGVNRSLGEGLWETQQNGLFSLQFGATAHVNDLVADSVDFWSRGKAVNKLDKRDTGVAQIVIRTDAVSSN